MNILLLKSLMCMICISQRQAPHVSMEAMQSTRRFLIPIWRHAIYTAVGLLQPGVRWSDRRPGYVARYRNLMPSLRARRAAERGYTLQYCSQDNSRASTDRGSLTRCERRRAELLTARSKHFAPHNLRLWLRWPIGANYSYSANFWLHYSAKIRIVNFSTMRWRIEYE